MPRIHAKTKSSAPNSMNRELVDRVHPDDRLEPGKIDRPETMRRVTVNLRENAVDWLHVRGHLTDRQHIAASRLRADFERAQMGARVTMTWDSAAGASGSRRAAPSPPDLSATAIDAKRRFQAALDAAGPGLSDILWSVACEGQGMTDAEKRLGWPARSGRLVLTLALDRVAGYYGLR